MFLKPAQILAYSFYVQKTRDSFKCVSCVSNTYIKYLVLQNNIHSCHHVSLIQLLVCGNPCFLNSLALLVQDPKSLLPVTFKDFSRTLSLRCNLVQFPKGSLCFSYLKTGPSNSMQFNNTYELPLTAQEKSLRNSFKYNKQNNHQRSSEFYQQRQQRK